MTQALYTRRGDSGTTTRFGCHTRFKKNGARFEALGSVDELNALLGLCRATLPFNPIAHELLYEMQQVLFVVQAELAGAPQRVTTAHLKKVEALVAQVERNVTNPHGFVVPGATRESALLDVARTVARRAERRVLSAESTLRSENTVAYLNRASSALYALARWYAAERGAREPRPHY